ncbi:ribosome small subunit-dependent GTPase A [Fusobacterium gastrosuis]|uniref:ribosome small subunit-dependent GTPase A n=1 Tax=Fusobacterium gastrosuis TaxID=1755100 RepID=UPI002976C84B|nr:ribosome small subunit-dependent GTPase A [Fusobacteriaceae bacterium]MDY5713730.1 ribosome small subunit-dependent GTPase A [Fusobacterium gastrosuis]
MKKGRVINKIQGFYYVEIENNVVIEAKLRGILKKVNNKFNCVVGDLVTLSEDNSIIEITKRKNLLIRPIVSNVDYMAIQFAAKNPSIDFERIHLLILNALFHKVLPLVIINKIDYLSITEINLIKNKLAYLKALDIPLFLISTKDNIGLENLEEFIKDKITVIGGPSGVGKSSLINILQNEYILKTGEISERLKRGKHTTRDSNMIKLKQGGYIIDTPGFSSIDIPDIKNKEELISLFPEFQNFNNCKFLNCSHTHEPSCAVKEAVENLKISIERYEFYKKVLSLLNERWNKYE